MIRRPPRSTLDRSSAASDVYKRQEEYESRVERYDKQLNEKAGFDPAGKSTEEKMKVLSLIHISEPTRPY